MISAGWKLVSPTRGQTLDGSRRCDEGTPARESLEALVGRETQALLDESHVVVLGSSICRRKAWTAVSWAQGSWVTVSAYCKPIFRLISSSSVLPPFG